MATDLNNIDPEARIRSRAIEQDVTDIKQKIEETIKSLYPTYEDRTGFLDFQRSALTGLLEGLAEKNPQLVKNILEGGKYETVDQLITALKNTINPDTGQSLLETPGAELFIESISAVPQTRHALIHPTETGIITSQILEASGYRPQPQSVFSLRLNDEEKQKLLDSIKTNVFEAVENKLRRGTPEEQQIASLFIERLKNDPTTKDLITKKRDWFGLGAERDTIDYSKLTWERLKNLPEDIQKQFVRSPEFKTLLEKTNAANLLLQTARGVQVAGGVRELVGKPIAAQEALTLGNTLLGGNLAQYTPEEARARLARYKFLAQQSGMRLSDLIETSVTAQQIASRYGLTGKIGTSITQAVLEQEAAYRKAGLTLSATGNLPDERIRSQITAERLSRGVQSEFAAKAALLVNLYKLGRLDPHQNPRLFALARTVAHGGIAAQGINLVDIDMDSLVEMISQETGMSEEALYGMTSNRELISKIMAESPGAMQALVEAQRFEAQSQIMEEAEPAIQSILERHGEVFQQAKDRTAAMNAIKQAAVIAYWDKEALQQTDVISQQKIRARKLQEFLKGGEFGEKLDISEALAQEIMASIGGAANALVQNDIYRSADVLIATTGLGREQREIGLESRAVLAEQIYGPTGREYVMRGFEYAEKERQSYNAREKPPEPTELLFPQPPPPAIPPPPAPENQITQSALQDFATNTRLVGWEIQKLDTRSGAPKAFMDAVYRKGATEISEPTFLTQELRPTTSPTPENQITQSALQDFATNTRLVGWEIQKLDTRSGAPKAFMDAVYRKGATEISEPTFLTQELRPTTSPAPESAIQLMTVPVTPSIKTAPETTQVATTEAEGKSRQPVIIKTDALYLRVSENNSAVISSNETSETYIG